MAPPHRMDQIGSLLRPPWLLEARSSLSSPSQMYEIATDDKIKQAEANAIREVVQKQLELDIRPIVSGEFCRHIFYGGFFEKLEGMTPEPDLPVPDAFRTDFPTTTGLAKMGAKTRAAVVCTGPIQWRESAYLEEWEILKSGLKPELWKEAKITMPAPNYQHIQLKPGTAFTQQSGYKADEEYFRALGKAYASEIKALYNAGCRQISVDDPHLTYFCSSQFLEGCEKDGVDTDALLDLYLEAHNYFLREKPGDDLHMGTHLCRGNMSGSTHWVSGSYDKIAKKLFTKTDHDTFYLEFDDTERTGGFECLQYLPRGKNVVLGLVSTKKAELENMEDLKRGIEQAAEWVAKGQGVSQEEALNSLSLSPQCGFSSSSLAGGKNMSMDRMWEKLSLVRDTARSVWQELQ
ncbi:Putative cobalamin-independent methionine synthase MetE/archaeal, UROD/MetE-like superfamily [Septoria linicola]|uniref:Cobalamin-independent methionine synthase MetE/archaeal, UROD/MetE-like superfamily n=1 Tax=Septoria linicola TaxID=215465 RepID=A0A9Q9APL5_9PEZI|nr:putative cobalamin-independent methionine synthase MetE/archaeal, UROD/MetE-like superfamily [Septoria linicola]USW49746.1 Putative cobalamin-independent methionine synthase MetE/archaeal, UROD/MetE-like superfamily [Septoria linicola]